MPVTAERRFLPSAPPVVKGRTVFGYAAKFNSRSENLGTADRQIFEVIQPGAFDGVLNDDVVAAFQHDESLILARSENGKGTLSLGVDETGLWYEFEAPDTQVGRDLLVSLQRGDIRGSSFAFQIADGGDRFTQEPGGVLRTITKIGKLHDISPVVRPAYKNTAVDARGLTGIPPVATPALNSWKRMFEFLK